MTSFNAYPPCVSHPSSSKRLSTPSAHTILSTFLHLANLDPAYRPDSTLSERGPESNSSSGNPNLTLHHLNRIMLGLEGTNLGAEDLGAGFFSEGKSATETTTRDSGGKKRKWQGRDAGLAPVKTGIPKVVSTAEDDVDAVLTAQGTDAQKAATVADGEGWQDREDFELAQDDEDVDVNNPQRDPAAADMEGMGEDIMEEETGGMVDVHEDLDGDDDAQEAEEVDRDAPSTERKRGLTEKEKDKRRERKKMRLKEKKTTAKKEKSKEGPKQPSKKGKDRRELKDTSSRKRKKVSKVGGET